MVMQVQLQVLLAVQEVGTEVAKLQVFDGAPGKILGFVIVCRLYIRMRIRKVAVKEQIQ